MKSAHLPWRLDIILSVLLATVPALGRATTASREKVAPQGAEPTIVRQPSDAYRYVGESTGFEVEARVTSFTGLTEGEYWGPPAGLEYAYGTINFNNRVSGVVDGRFYDGDGTSWYPLAGPFYLAQLYAGANQAALPTGPPLTFRTGAAAGYINTIGVDTTRYVPGVRPGEVAEVQIRAWEASGGATFEAAARAGKKTLKSMPLRLVTGGNGYPPMDLVGLSATTVPVFLGDPTLRFIAQPAGGIFYVGETAVLGFKVAGASPRSVVWFHGWHMIPGANSATLVLENLEPADAGTYRASVTTSKGTEGNSTAEVSVVPAPVVGSSVHFSNRAQRAALDAPVYDFDGTRVSGGQFVAQLYAGITSDRLAPVGARAPFGTGSEAGYWQPGAEPVQYQWRFNGAELAGETGDTLHVPVLRGESGGVYQVLVSNGYGTTASDAVTVRLDPGAECGGTVHLDNWVPAAGVDARLFDERDQPLSGTAWVAQLYGGPTSAERRSALLQRSATRHQRRPVLPGASPVNPRPWPESCSGNLTRSSRSTRLSEQVMRMPQGIWGAALLQRP